MVTRWTSFEGLGGEHRMVRAPRGAQDITHLDGHCNSGVPARGQSGFLVTFVLSHRLKSVLSPQKCSPRPSETGLSQSRRSVGAHGSVKCPSHTLAISC